MALGFGSGRKVDNDTQNIGVNDTRASDSSPEKNESYGDYDPESGAQGGRKMSRIGGVMADEESELSVGKQLELEQSNSIKYRTCTWQKVIGSFPSPTLRNNESDLLQSIGLRHILLFGHESEHHCEIEIFLTFHDRPLLYSFRSTSVWLSCHFHTPTLSWAWSLA